MGCCVGSEANQGSGPKSLPLKEKNEVTQKKQTGSQINSKSTINQKKTANQLEVKGSTYQQQMIKQVGQKSQKNPLKTTKSSGISKEYNNPENEYQSVIEQEGRINQQSSSEISGARGENKTKYLSPDNNRSSNINPVESIKEEEHSSQNNHSPQISNAIHKMSYCPPQLLSKHSIKNYSSFNQSVGCEDMEFGESGKVKANLKIL